MTHFPYSYVPTWPTCIGYMSNVPLTSTISWPNNIKRMSNCQKVKQLEEGLQKNFTLGVSHILTSILIWYLKVIKNSQNVNRKYFDWSWWPSQVISKLISICVSLIMSMSQTTHFCISLYYFSFLGWNKTTYEDATLQPNEVYIRSLEGSLLHRKEVLRAWTSEEHTIH